MDGSTSNLKKINRKERQGLSDIYLGSCFMRYHYTRPDNYIVTHAVSYKCSHPVYTRCTLYLIEENGLAVIQQYYDPKTKQTWWGEIYPWLIDEIFSREGFLAYFSKFAGAPENDIYPTVTVRQIMWALKMKPLKRDIWETCFDHTPI